MFPFFIVYRLSISLRTLNGAYFLQACIQPHCAGPLMEKKERKTKDNMEEDSRKRDEDHAALLGVTD